MSTAPVRFGLVGSGWRSEFFARLARLVPDRLQLTGVVTRSAERGAEVAATWSVPAYRTVDELLVGDGRPEFVIPSVPWPVTPEVTRDLVRREMPVLAETPPAPDVEGLRTVAGYRCERPGTGGRAVPAHAGTRGPARAAAGGCDR